MLPIIIFRKSAHVLRRSFIKSLTPKGCVVCLLVLFSPTLWALEELAEIAPLAPMDGPGDRDIGWQWHYVDANGEPGYREKVAGDEFSASYERTDGCHWTRSIKGFAPASEWSDCPSTGKATVSFTEGDIWPLTVGAEFTWRIQGKSNLIGRVWKSGRSCTVLPSVRIKTVLGENDVHKLHCKERWGTRTWWLSPKVGTAIAYRQSSRRGVIMQEMTHIKE